MTRSGPVGPFHDHIWLGHSACALGHPFSVKDLFNEAFLCINIYKRIQPIHNFVAQLLVFSFRIDNSLRLPSLEINPNEAILISRETKNRDSIPGGLSHAPKS